MVSNTVSELVNDWHSERPDLDIPPLELFVLINRLSDQFIKRAEKWLSPLGLSWESFSLIVTLRRVGAPFALRPGDLLKVSLLTSGAITNRIDRVEQLGLVERHREPNDRRGVVVRLTPAGQTLADRAIAVHFEHMNIMFAGLTKTEVKLATGLLSKLLGSLEEEPQETQISTQKEHVKVSKRDTKTPRKI
jgi:DNA-binding MarR family transcriptional regulator